MLQTGVMRNGEWITESVDLQSVLKATSTVRSPKKQRVTRPTPCGLLSQTIVDSPLANFALPIRLRSDAHNDIVFVGDHYVKIQELRRDGHVIDIIKKNDFGSRIRNAAVVGGSFSKAGPSRSKEEDFDMTATVKTETTVTPFDSSAPYVSPFPSQLLLLVLESGDLVFLFVKTTAHGPEFVTSRFHHPRTDFAYPGSHLAVDPSSRYMVLACADQFFAVYELESLATLGERYRNDQPLRPVRSFRGRSLPGVIHKIAFLYPRPEDKEHVFLFMVVVRDGQSWMLPYEWKLGDDLRPVLSAAKSGGFRVPTKFQMPYLIVPLTVNSSFMAISLDGIVICTGLLQGQPRFDAISELQPDPPTEQHHGRHDPLYTAWARPIREGNYFVENDCFFLAREDGVVKYYVAESNTSYSIQSTTKLDHNISSAFTCTYDLPGDVLVVGGDSSLGGMWQLIPRESKGPNLLKSLHNWTPTVDFVTTHEPQAWKQAAGARPTQAGGWQQREVAKPDQIFAASGRGLEGCITEYRQGLQATILTYGDTSELADGDSTKLGGLCADAAREAWLLRADADSSQGSFYLLFCMPDRSAILHASSDLLSFSVLSEQDSNLAPYDLSSRTVAATLTESQLAIQVTEQSITVSSGGKRLNFLHLSEMILSPSSTPVSVSDGAVLEDLVAISAHTGTAFHIHIFRLDAVSFEPSRVPTFESVDVNGEVTCLALCPHVGLLVGIWHNGRPKLARYDLQDSTNFHTMDLFDHLSRSGSSDNLESIKGIDAICNIVSFPGLLVLGTRSGEVITITKLPPSISVKVEKFGNTRAKVTRARLGRYDDSPAVFVCCDSALVLLSAPKPAGMGINAGRFSKRRRVWPLLSNDVHGSTSKVDFVISAGIYGAGIHGADTNAMTFLMVSGKQIQHAMISHQNTLVPRHMPIEGTPTSMIYSHYLRCLVVAVTVQNCPTLVFLDPTSGADLGRPTDKNGESLNFTSGLGKEGDKILGLSEWEVKKDVNTWHFILVATRHSRMLVVSTERMQSADVKTLPIRYWTRFKKSFERPVYSILGYNEGLVYCVGTTLHFDVLDMVEKKLKLLHTFDLGSPATSLSMMNGKIVALTNRDSLDIIEPPSMPDSGTSDHPALRHADSKPRNTVHMIEVASAHPDDPLANLILVADRECQVAALWVPWQNPGRDCETMLVADLPASVRKFRRGHTRPIWSERRPFLDSPGHDHEYDVPLYGRLAASSDDAEVLGVCLDGSMQHLTLLGPDAWRLLRFIQNVAARSEEICPFTYNSHAHVTGAEFDPEPMVAKGEQLHVDGDILGRCLEKRALERLVASPPYISRFMQLLDELDHGRYTAKFAHGSGALEMAARPSDDMMEDEVSTGLSEQMLAAKYLDLAYEVLEYFLAPVF